MTRPDDDLDDILDLDRRGTMAMRGRWGNGVGMSGCKQKSWRTSRKYAGRSFRTGADLEGDPVANDGLELALSIRSRWLGDDASRGRPVLASSEMASGSHRPHER